MPLLAENYAERIAFFNNRIALWLAEATEIGTNTAAVTELQTRVTSALAKLAAQQTARSAAKSATADLIIAMDAMTNAGMIIIEQVRTKARTAGPEVYVLADIPAPAVPGKKPAPGKVTDITIELDGVGNALLKWKSANAPGTSGTMYQIWRRVNDEVDFTYLAGVGQKEFLDTTLPGGVIQATYKLQAVRSTAVGPWATYLVIFNNGSSGAPSVTVTETTPKMAA